MNVRGKGRAGRTAGTWAVVLGCVALGVGGGVGLKALLTGGGDDAPRALVGSSTPGSSTPGAPGPTPSGTTSSGTASPGTASPGTGDGSGIDLAVSGDLLVHQPVATRARKDAGGGKRYDFTGMLAPVKPLISGADLAICHAETPISYDNRKLSGYPRFWVPRELAAGIAATGYDGCSTASNHTLDQGQDGIAATLTALDRAGVGHTGSARTPAEAQEVKVYDVRGVKVAHLSYAYGFNGFQPPTGKEWVVNRIKVSAILAQAHRARQSGAQLVVVSLHWGVEYHTAPTADQLEVADALTRSDDVDVIVGHHAHVLQPIRTVNGKLVIFGLGNLLSAQSSRAGLPSATQDGAVVLVHAEPDPDAAAVPGGASRYRVSTYRAVLTVVEAGSFRVRPVADVLASPSGSSTLRRDARAAMSRERKVDPAYGSGATLPVGS